MRLAALRGKLAAQPHPLRWLASRACSQLLYSTGLCSLFTIDRGDYRIEFSRSAMALAMWRHPDYWRDEEAFFRAHLGPGQVVVDIGANIGVNTVLAAALVGTRGQVVAVEAHPVAFARLQRNIVLNGCHHVLALHAAVGAARGSIHISRAHPDDSQNRVSETGIAVPLDTLDALVGPRVGAIDLLKVDVEGYERHVFAGAAAVLRRTRAVYFEVFDPAFAVFGYTASDVIAQLTGAGFTVCSVRGGEVGPPVPASFRAPACTNLLALRR